MEPSWLLRGTFQGLGWEIGMSEGKGGKLRRSKGKAKFVYPKKSPRNGMQEAQPVLAGNESFTDWSD